MTRLSGEVETLICRADDVDLVAKFRMTRLSGEVETGQVGQVCGVASGWFRMTRLSGEVETLLPPSSLYFPLRVPDDSLIR